MQSCVAKDVFTNDPLDAQVALVSDSGSGIGRATRFDTVLVANRGEIAVRIIRTAKAEGYRTVSVYSDADSDAPHVRAADLAVRLGPPPPHESYLDAGRLIEAARRSGAQAVHPGYGFLSERASFARTCLEAGLVFIGPSPEAIEVMGDKAVAKRRMAEAAVPMLPGYQGEDQSDERLLDEARSIGLPLMVKAAAGGGGKGMRLVTDARALPAALAAARREALAAFGSDTLILERALLNPRHVEIQVLGDEHGRILSLGERDCSVQRRHQKVLEESPGPTITPALRQAMSEAAVAAAAAVRYVGAGTVEFLVDENGRFAFLEMNTRLQVEHPVTEFVTGLDLVAWQLRIAQGEPLTLSQQDVRLDGHAIEARLYAEDPGKGFLPAVGTIVDWQPPAGEGIRVDAGIASGSRVTPHYDPMLAKIIAHGRDRAEACRRLLGALERTRALGLVTNRTFLVDIVRHAGFGGGGATTAFLAEHDLATRREPTRRELAVAAAWLYRTREVVAADRSPGLSGWSNAAGLRSSIRFEVGGRFIDVHLLRRRSALTVTIEEDSHEIDTRDGRLVVDGVAVQAHGRCIGLDRVLLAFADLDLDLIDVLFAAPEADCDAGSGVVLAPMHGVVSAVFVHAGSLVEVGDPLLVLEAMKMETPIIADVAGTVSEVTGVRQQVSAQDLLVRITPEMRPADAEPAHGA